MERRNELAGDAGRPALQGTRRCYLHTGSNAKQAGRRGGLRRRVFDPANLSPLETPKDAEDAARFIAVTMHEVRMSRLDPRIANALGQLGMVFLKAIETGDLARRVAALEGKDTAQ